MAGSDPAENLNFEMSGMFPLAITAEDKQIVPSATASQVLFLKRLFTHTGYDRIPGGIPASQTAPGEDSTAQLPLHLVDLYEYRTTASPASSPRQVLRHLMDRRQLKQADLAPVFGTVSEALNGKRQINAKQARKLADYFHISAGVFV